MRALWLLAFVAAFAAAVLDRRGYEWLAALVVAAALAYVAPDVWRRP